MTGPHATGLSVAEAEALGAGPATVIAELIDAATTEARLDDLRLAVCAHPRVGLLARRLAGRRAELRTAAASAARDVVTSAVSS